MLTIFLSLYTQQSYSSVKDITDKTLETLQKELDNSFVKTRKRAEEVSERHNELIKRQKIFSEQNGGYLINDNDIIKINVGGTFLSVRRETLSSIKGSRLEALFSGRWENRLLRDEDGNVFMDLNPDTFKEIIEYLHRYKLSSLLPVHCKSLINLESDPKKELGLYVNFFGLKDEQESDNGAPTSVTEAPKTEEISVYNKLFDCIKKEESELMKLEKSFNKCEKYMGEESYVSFFVTRTGSSKEDEEDEDNDNFAMVNHDEEQNDASMEDCSKVEFSNSTLNLSVGGEIMTVKRSTLCFCKGSVLAQQFSDDKWIKSQTIKIDNGKEAVLIEQPASSFRKMINQLRLRSMLEPDTDYYCKRNSVETPMLKELVSYYFPGKENVIFGDYKFDSNIVDSNDSNQIKSWLEDMDETCEPDLLYSGSRDGWSTQDFHAKCDGMGPTITIVQTKEGYVFGAYSDKSFQSASTNYESSRSAFLFSIKCHAGLPPFTLDIREESQETALYNGGVHYGPHFGGGCGDFCIGRDGCTKSGSFYFGAGSYHLPDFCESTFLVGHHGRHLEFDEVEVFAV